MKVSRKKSNAALTLVELLLVLGVLTILILVFHPGLPRGPYKAIRIGCVSNLKQLGLAFRTWAGDNNDKYPMQVSTANGGTMEFVSLSSVFPHFQVMSNELYTPKLLICPADDSRKAATNFTTDLNNSRLSYFVGVDAVETNVTMFLSGDRNITDGLPARNGIVTLTTNRLVSWTKKVHKNAGNLLFTDGHVEQMDSRRLNEALKNTGVVTNRLAVP